MGFEPKYFKVNNLLETMRKVFFKKSTKCETDIEGAGCDDSDLRHDSRRKHGRQSTVCLLTFIPTAVPCAIPACSFYAACYRMSAMYARWSHWQRLGNFGICRKVEHQTNKRRSPINRSRNNHIIIIVLRSSSTLHQRSSALTKICYVTCNPTLLK